MNIRAEITKAGIELATRRNKAHCAIAHAIALEYPTFRRIEVDQNTIRFTDTTTRLRYIYRTPDAQRDLIAAWDNGEAVTEWPPVKLERRHLVRVNEPRERNPNEVLRPRTTTSRAPHSTNGTRLKRPVPA